MQRFGNWYNSDRAAQEGAQFLNSGTNAYSNQANFHGTSKVGCRDSGDCASGWRCSKGFCEPPVNDSGGGDSSNDFGCGGGPGQGGGGGPCGANTGANIALADEETWDFYKDLLADMEDGDFEGHKLAFSIEGNTAKVYVDGKCVKTGCGGTGSIIGGPTDVCCGDTRCCRYRSAGSAGLSVGCACGPCPPQEGCDSFCSNYMNAVGRPAAGCSGPGKVCDECSSCQYVSSTGVKDTYACKKRTSGAPCHCEGGAECGDCQTCGPEGSCVSALENCQECCNLINQPCPCGKTVTIRHCRSADRPTSDQPCNQEAASKVAAACAQACGGDSGTSDPCADVPCVTRTLCNPGATCADDEELRGSIEAGGETCILCTKCDYPEDCLQPEPCDCNCENDCPACQICNAQGKCEPDPTCANPGEQCVYVAPAGAPGSYLEDIVSNSVGGPPVPVAGPYSQGESGSASFAYYTQRTIDCNGQPVESALIAYGAPGTVPPFPAFRLEEGGTCVECEEGFTEKFAVKYEYASCSDTENPQCRYYVASGPTRPVSAAPSNSGGCGATGSEWQAGFTVTFEDDSSETYIVANGFGGDPTIVLSAELQAFDSDVTRCPNGTLVCGEEDSCDQDTDYDQYDAPDDDEKYEWVWAYNTFVCPYHTRNCTTNEIDNNASRPNGDSQPSSGTVSAADDIRSIRFSQPRAVSDAQTCNPADGPGSVEDRCQMFEVQGKTRDGEWITLGEARRDCDTTYNNFGLYFERDTVSSPRYLRRRIPGETQWTSLVDNEGTGAGGCAGGGQPLDDPLQCRSNASITYITNNLGEQGTRVVAPAGGLGGYDLLVENERQWTESFPDPEFPYTTYHYEVELSAWGFPGGASNSNNGGQRTTRTLQASSSILHRPEDSWMVPPDWSLWQFCEDTGQSSCGGICECSGIPPDDFEPADIPGYGCGGSDDSGCDCLEGVLLTMMENGVRVPAPGVDGIGTKGYSPSVINVAYSNSAVKPDGTVDFNVSYQIEFFRSQSHCEQGIPTTYTGDVTENRPLNDPPSYSFFKFCDDSCTNCGGCSGSPPDSMGPVNCG